MQAGVAAAVAAAEEFTVKVSHHQPTTSYMHAHRQIPAGPQSVHSRRVTIDCFLFVIAAPDPVLPCGAAPEFSLAALRAARL